MVDIGQKHAGNTGLKGLLNQEVAVGIKLFCVKMDVCVDQFHAANLTKFAAYNPQPLPRFLLVRFSSIGDIVLTSPVIRCIKQQVPGAEVHFITKEAYKSVLEHNPYIDSLITFSSDFDEQLEELKQQQYDFIVDMHHNLRSLQLKRKLSRPSASFPKLNIQKWLLVNLKWNRMPAQHIVDRYLQTVKGWKVKNDGKGLDFFPAPGSEAVLNTLPANFSDAYVAVAIGAQHSTKIMPSDKLGRVLKNFGKPVVLLGGKEDRIRGSQIELHMGSALCFNAAGKISLGESAELIRSASLVLSHDTGLMHIAAAFRKPIISLWGNTVPAFGMFPYMPGDADRSLLLEVKNLACRPCSKIGFDKCPKGHFQCMRGITDESMLEALHAFWKNRHK